MEIKLLLSTTTINLIINKVVKFYFKQNLFFKRYLITVILLAICLNSNSQDFGGDKVSIGNFVKRMYFSQPFDGIKILQSQGGKDFLISVVQLKKDKGRPANIENRIASTKAKGYANQFINGSNVNSDVLMISSEIKINESVIKKIDIQEIFNEKSKGIVEGMEILTSFENIDETMTIYVFYREIK